MMHACNLLVFVLFQTLVTIQIKLYFLLGDHDLLEPWISSQTKSIPAKKAESTQSNAPVLHSAHLHTRA